MDNWKGSCINKDSIDVFDTIACDLAPSPVLSAALQEGARDKFKFRLIQWSAHLSLTSWIAANHSW